MRTWGCLDVWCRLIQVDPDWMYGEGPTYGSIALGHVVFDVDNEGMAIAVSPSALRTTLTRVG